MFVCFCSCYWGNVLPIQHEHGHTCTCTCTYMQLACSAYFYKLKLLANKILEQVVFPIHYNILHVRLWDREKWEGNTRRAEHAVRRCG